VILTAVGTSPVELGERLDRRLGVITVLGVADVPDGLLRARLRGLRHEVEDPEERQYLAEAGPHATVGVVGVPIDPERQGLGLLLVV
jgi:hypothetical protein